MELFELKYFLAVAKTENVNRAAEEINISTGSLSKAISRLEVELQTPLFFKLGRGIRLTPQGQLLKKRAAQILQLEEDARLELTGRELGSLNIYISSDEILQTSFGGPIARLVDGLFPKARIQFLVRPEAKAIEQILDGEVHLAFITHETPVDVISKVLSKVEFQTCASAKHPLFKKYNQRQSIPVEEILKYPFALPESAMFGRIAKSTSVDGWRDDKFPRQIKYKVSGLKLMENLIHEGLALGFLPDYFIKSSELIPLKVSGCPYSCHQTIRVVAKDPKSLGWLDKLWDAL